MGFWNEIKQATKRVVGAAATIAVVAAVAYAATYAGVYFGGAAAGTAAAGAAAATAAATAAYTAAAATAISVALNDAEAPDIPDAGDAISGQLVTGRAPAENVRIIYGKTRVGGNIVFLELINGNKDLYSVASLAGHQISSISKIYLNDAVVKENPDFNTQYDLEYNGKSGFLSVEVSNGSDSGTTFNLLSGTSGASKTFKGLACIAIKLKYDQDVYAQGIPNITVELTGKNSTSNAATAIKDYLMDSVYGLSVPIEEIDTTAFATAEAICDEDIDLAAGGTEKRYTVNGAFSSGDTPQSILQRMVSSCSGYLVYVGGKWSLRVGKYTSPVMEITEDEITSGISISTSDSRRDTFNAVKGVYSEPTSLYQPQTYSPVTNSLYETQDGEQIFRDRDFQLVTSNATCQRLAKIMLEKARQQIVINFTCNLKAFKVQVGDIVEVTLDRYGWDQKQFEVIDWSGNLGQLNPSVSLTLRETAPGVWDWNSGEETQIDLAEDTNLPDPFDIDAPGLHVFDELVVIAEKVVTKLVVQVSGDSTFFDRYEVEAKLTTDDEYINMGQASGTRFELLDAADGETYDIRARQISTMGVRSDYATAQHQVVGKTEPPSDITNLRGNLIGNQYLLSWSPVPDLDLSYYRVRFAAEGDSPTYNNSISLVPKVARPATSVLVPARNGTYFVKAVDKLGLASETPATIVLSSNIDELENFNGVITLNEHPDFNGTFDDTVENDEEDRLVLTTAVLFDGVTGNFDDAEGLFDGGSGNVDLEGFYYFDDTVDFGSTFLARCRSVIKHTRRDYVVLFDSTTGLFDDRQGVFDGDVNAFDDVDVEVQARTTDDDPTGTPTWSDWVRFDVADFRCRAMQFRAKLTTTDEQATPAVSFLQVQIDMGIRTESGEDITSGAASKVVTFTRPFYETPAIGIGAQDMQTGDYYTLSSKSRSGFTITFYDSTDTAVSRTFDYVAKGLGREVA